MSIAQPVSQQPPTMGDVENCDAKDPVETAKAAGLRYVTDARPGIRRKRAGKNFSYIGLNGKPIRDPAELQRFKSLGIPPAWTNVWICPRPNGHIQATGRDAKGRKQYRYHPRWRQIRDETKYDRMISFAQILPRLRAQVAHDLSLSGLPREKLLATLVRLLDTTLIRIGNEEYARENNSYGLTTMRNEHVDVTGSKVEFHFRGKSGKEHVIDVRDRQLARIVKRSQDLPGHELFEYIDEKGELRTVESSDVNDYLQEISGQNITAKDFRTWGGTVSATEALQDLGAFETQTEAKKNVVQAIKVAAQELGNTPTICRKCYVHPAIIDAYMNGSLLNFIKQYHEQHSRVGSDGESGKGLLAPPSGAPGLRPEESLVLAFLEQDAANDTKS